MKNKHPKKNRFRLLKAYRTTFRILISFAWIQLAGYFLGSSWKTRKMDVAYHRNAKRLKKTILDLRGLFIKVGQLISIMSNFLPEEFRSELEGLQDKIPPRPYKEIAESIHKELGESPENLFKSFNKTPIASASLAQVHEAFMHDGTKVAVKVQYTDIEKMAKMDLKTLQRILSFIAFIFRVKGIDTNFEQVREMILDELDFKKEAEYIETIAANFENDPTIKFPSIVHKRSSKRILTTSFMEGTKVTDLLYLKKHNIDNEDLANRIITAYCQMIFIDGIYHADPHPGNLLVQTDGSIVFLDFGAVAILSPAMKEGIPQFLEGILKRDKAKITDALRLMGFIALGDNGYDVDTLIDYVYSSFLQELSFDSWSLDDIQIDMETKMEMMGDLNKLNISVRDLMAKIQVPKDWVLLERTVLLLMGLCTHLEPEMNPMKTIRPYLENFVLGKDKDWKNFVATIVKDMAISIFKMPAEMNKAIEKTNRGELEFRIKDIDQTAKLLYRLGHQVLYSLFLMMTGGLAYYSYLRNDTELANWFAGVSVFFALSLSVSMWRVRKGFRKNRK